MKMKTDVSPEHLEEIGRTLMEGGKIQYLDHMGTHMVIVLENQNEEMGLITRTANDDECPEDCEFCKTERDV